MPHLSPEHARAEVKLRAQEWHIMPQIWRSGPASDPKNGPAQSQLTVFVEFILFMGVFWCPGEDAAHAKLSSKNKGLRGDQLSKVVPKAVPIVLLVMWEDYANRPRILRLMRLCFGRYQSASPLKPKIINENAVMSASMVPRLQVSHPVRWKTPKT